MELRSAARELAHLAIFQLPKNPEKLAKTDLHAICLAAIRSLAQHGKDNLKQAESFLVQVERKLLVHQSEHPSNEPHTKVEDFVHVEVPTTGDFGEEIDKCYHAISLAKEALKLPELYWHFSNPAVEEFAINLILLYINNREEADNLIEETAKSWKLDRIHKVDKNILRIAICEMLHSDTPHSVAASEAIKLANKYSTREGVKFINGIVGDIVESLSEKTS